MSAINPISDPSIQGLTTAPKQSIADIILQVGIAAMQANDQKIELFYDQVRQNTVMMQNFNNAIAVANTHTNATEKTGSVTFLYTDPQTGKQSQKEVWNFMEENHISHPDAGWAGDQWKEVVESLKNASDSLGSTNQIDMMKLQSVIQKQNEMTQMVSDNMSKMSQIALAIISNMR